MIRRWLRGLGFVFVAMLAPAGSQASGPTILVLGDSLSAGYGIDVRAGWVALLEVRLRNEGYPHRVVNASVTGETTSGGLARMPSALERHKPAVVLIELGGNDGLRGLPVGALRDNLRRMIRLARAAGARPIVFEMQIPPNYGAAYADDFRRSFGEVAREEGAAIVPFLLADIALKPEFFQDDGIHPSAAAQARLLDAVWPSLAPLLRAPGARAAASGAARPP